jgi:ribosome-binding protein aMBF1 (putative translation factor)
VEDATWEPEENLQEGCGDLLEIFQQEEAARQVAKKMARGQGSSGFSLGDVVSRRGNILE